MEIFKNLDNPLTKEFEQLLNNQLSKIQMEIYLKSNQEPKA